MLSFEERISNIIIKLYEVDALKFGDYKMKVGINSPVYFDLRVIVSYPALMNDLSKLLLEFIEKDAEFDHVCGVPYTALPIATLISVHGNIPMLIRRKESKSYGTKKLIEGKFNNGDKCMIIEDVVTSGSSILDTYKDLKQEGLGVTKAVVVVDRQQGGTENVAQYGVQMKSLCTLTQIMHTLYKAGKVDQETVDKVVNYIANSQIPLVKYIEKIHKEPGQGQNRLKMTYTERASQCINSVSAELFKIMAQKKSNLCIAADKTNSADILNLAKTVGPHICLLKTHCDIIEDFDENFVQELLKIAKEQNFLIMEDRKFADIGHVVSLQYTQGKHMIISWADLVTVHAIPGEGVLEGLKSMTGDRKRGCFVVAEMSSKGNLTSGQYASVAAELSMKHADFVSGVVCQTANLVRSVGQLQLTPGVAFGTGPSNDGLGQQYASPEDVVLDKGADIAVAGRAITDSLDPEDRAAEMRARLWRAYEQRVGLA